MHDPARAATDASAGTMRSGRSRFDARYLVVASGALLLVIVWSLLAIYVANGRQSEVESRLRENDNLARMVEEHAVRTVSSVDQVLRFLVQELEQFGIDYDVRKHVNDKALNSEIFVQVGAIDEHGILVSPTRFTKPINLGDREHFKVHVHDRDAGLFVSKPVLGRSSGKWSIQMSRRVNKADGSFGGVIVISMDTAYFVDFYRRIEVGRGGAVAMLGTDGITRAARVGDIVSIGDDWGAQSAAWRAAGGNDKGHLRDVSWPDASRRDLSWRAVRGLPLMVVVGTARAETMAEFEATVRGAIGIATLVSLVLAGVSILMLRTFSREQVAMRALLDSEARFTAAFNQSSVGIVYLSLDGRYLRVNPRFCAITGYPESELIGRLSDDMSHPDDRAGTAEGRRQVLEGRGDAYTRTKRYIRADGSVVWVDISVSLIRDATAAPMYLHVMVEDVTERVRAEAAAAESRRQLQFALEGSSLALWDLHLSNRRVYLSEGWSVLMGGEPEPLDVAIDDLFKMVHPVDRGAVTDAFRAVLNQETTEYRVEHRVRNRDGAWTWIQSVGKVSDFDPQGRPSRVTGTNANISSIKNIQSALEEAKSDLEARVAERTAELGAANDQLASANDRLAAKVVEAENARRTLAQQVERLRASENRNRLLASIVEQTDEAILTRGMDGRILTWNGAAARLFGYTPEEAIGQPVGTLHQAGMTAEERTRTLDRIRSGTQLSREVRRSDRSGSLVDLWITNAPLFDDQGRQVGEVSVMRDITERKQVERELRHAKASAEAANRAKSDFLANMSHEIRTPMNGILGMAELLLDTPLSAEQREQLDIIMASGRGLLTVINDVLDLSKIEAGRLDIEAIEFGPRNCATEVQQTFALTARSKGLRLDVLVADDVPRVLIGDPGRVRQVMLNLVGNAIKFTEHGAVAITLRAVERTDDWLTLEVAVRDSGIGIPADKLEAIFKPFSQADSGTTRRYGGTGLGLTISARLCALMGGAVSVQSTPGQGSTFTFTVRCAIAQGREPTQPQLSGAALNQGLIRADGSDTPFSILLVEDNVVNQKVAVRMLTRIGCRVTVACNGREGVEMFAAGGHDLVLMDMQMPEMDGLESTQAIREREQDTGAPRIPIVGLTANALQGDRDVCLAAGMDDYLTKPFDAASLRRILQRWLVASEPA